MNEGIVELRKMVLALAEVTTAKFVEVPSIELVREWSQQGVILRHDLCSGAPAYIVREARWMIGAMVYSTMDKTTVLVKVSSPNDEQLFHKVLVEGKEDEEVESFILKLDEVREKIGAKFKTNLTDLLKGMTMVKELAPIPELLLKVERRI